LHHKYFILYRLCRKCDFWKS